MKITIITVAYNSKRTIRDTMESVLAQSFQDYEYIVVDGASTDGTMDIVWEMETRFHGRLKNISEPDHGIYDAMNKGIKMASGDIIGILNSDDIFHDNYAVEHIVKAFDENPDADAIYADLFYVRQNNTNKVVRKWRAGKQRSFAKGWLPAHPSFYVKKSVYERYGLFNLDYKLAADFEMMLRLVERYHIKIAYLPIPLVRMRLGGATNRSIKNIIQQDRECVRAFYENDIPVSRLYLLYRWLPKIKQFL